MSGMSIYSQDRRNLFPDSCSAMEESFPKTMESKILACFGWDVPFSEKLFFMKEGEKEELGKPRTDPVPHPLSVGGVGTAWPVDSLQP